MHELGHQIGLMPSDYEGIDSRDLSYTEYTSVMNYNAPLDTLQFSSTGSFNDWKHVENSYPDISPSTAEID
jgi:hypothetical protein